jgi:hypothetical protein
MTLFPDNSGASGTGHILAYGPQLTNTASLVSYIPTAGFAVTKLSGTPFVNVNALALNLQGGVTVGSSAGASCPSGITAGTVVVVNGIVTHC